MTREEIYQNTAFRLMKQYQAALAAQDTETALQLDKDIDRVLAAAIEKAQAELPRREERDPQEAFKDAIDQGRLSEDKYSANYAGNYMFMGTYQGRDTFKHHLTRKYIP